jgi:tRNA A37 threonylcarbamoyladenosine synthetase subunit TsaC/SUA5/YrdC
MIKGRPLIDPLIVHVPTIESLKAIAEYDSRIEKISSFWPGPYCGFNAENRVFPI